MVSVEGWETHIDAAHSHSVLVTVFCPFSVMFFPELLVDVVFWDLQIVNVISAVVE